MAHANETYNTSIEELIQTEVLGESVRDWVEGSNFMMPLMEEGDLRDADSLTITFPRLVAVSASAKTNQYDSVSLTELTTEEATITASEAANVTAEVMDITARTTKHSVEELVARAFGMALNTKFNSDGIALINAFSNTVGSTTVALSISTTIAASTDLYLNAEQYADQAVYIVHPEGVEDVRLEAVDKTNGTAVALGREQLIAILGDTPNSKVLNAVCGSIHGIPLLQTKDVPTMNAGADSGSCLMCVGPGGKALGYGVKWDPEIESQRNIANKKKSTIYYGSYCYGVGELDDNLGITMVHSRT